MKLSPRTTTLTLGLLMVGFIAGCGSTATSSPAPIPSTGVSRNAAWGLDGTNLQLVNNSGSTITVVNLVSDSSHGLGGLENDGTASAEGTKALGYDVRVDVIFPDKQRFTLSATNRAGVPPDVNAGEDCGDIPFVDGAENDYFVQDHGVNITRLPDNGWKQFRVTFTATRSAVSTNLCTFKSSDTAAEHG